MIADRTGPTAPAPGSGCNDGGRRLAETFLPRRLPIHTGGWRARCCWFRARRRSANEGESFVPARLLITRRADARRSWHTGYRIRPGILAVRNIPRGHAGSPEAKPSRSSRAGTWR